MLTYRNLYEQPAVTNRSPALSSVAGRSVGVLLLPQLAFRRVPDGISAEGKVLERRKPTSMPRSPGVLL